MDWVRDYLLPLLELIILFITLPTLVYGLITTRLFWIKRTLARSLERSFRKAGFSEIDAYDIARRVDALCELEGFDVGGEIDWLCKALRQDAADPVTIIELVSNLRLRDLATAYEDHRARLNRRILLTAGQVPLIDQSIQLARDTAKYLRAVSAGMSVVSGTKFRIHIPERAMTLDFLAFPDPSNGVHAFDLVVSYRRHLLFPEQGLEEWLDTRSFSDKSDIPTSALEQGSLFTMFTSGRTFDTALPRLVGTRIERDTSSGRTRLLLSLTACTYSSVVLDHYPATEQVEHYLGNLPGERLVARGVRTGEYVNGQLVGLLTLSMIVITRDRYLALTRRSGIIGSYENRYGASVNGNMELLERSGIAVDFDRYGIPDPKLALAREAKEELGLAIEPDTISITGLMKFDAPTERGTNVLLSLARTHITLDELALHTQYADPVEGAWEIGRDILGIRLPRTQAEFDEIVHWLVHAGDLTPHATAAAVAALVTCTKFTLALETLPSGESGSPPSGHLFRRVHAGGFFSTPT